MNIKTWQEREGVPADTQGHTLDHCVAPAMQAEIDELRAALQPVQPAPLTDAEIEKLREKTFSTNNPFCPVDSKSMRKAIRAYEALRTGGAG